MNNLLLIDGLIIYLTIFFKYIYPLNSDEFNNDLKEKISTAEILSSTF